MRKMIDVQTACELLKSWDDILILTHQRPDGDTLGSAFALMWALEALGKRVRVECPDPIPQRYDFIVGEYTPEDFSPRFVVTVDIASSDLLGSLQPVWADKLDLCIDHHLRNDMQPRHLLLDSGVPAAAQLVYQVIKGLPVQLDKKIATAIFFGIATDTGCFRYSGVTAQTHRVAAELIEAGADHVLVNRLMFSTESRARIELDKMVLNALEYHFGGLCAFVAIPMQAIDSLQIEESELDGVSATPIRIQGVEVGIVLREGSGEYRVSVRTRGKVDASVFCAKFGGGGHKEAGGCTIQGDEPTVRTALFAAVSEALQQAGLSWA